MFCSIKTYFKLPLSNFCSTDSCLIASLLKTSNFCRFCVLKLYLRTDSVAFDSSRWWLLNLSITRAYSASNWVPLNGCCGLWMFCFSRVFGLSSKFKLSVDFEVVWHDCNVWRGRCKELYNKKLCISRVLRQNSRENAYRCFFGRMPIGMHDEAIT